MVHAEQRGTDADVAIIGAGAAGLATAIFLARTAPRGRVVLLDGARSPGAKILVSGGTRCNVTNTVVTESDFNGGSKAAIRRVLRAFPADAAAAFFRGLAVSLHEEAGGKLFPDSGRSRDVLDALLTEVRRLGIDLRAGTRVVGVDHSGGHFTVVTSAPPLRVPVVVLATGGLSLPKTGSDGAGYELARRFGHTIVPTTPALAPLTLARGEDGDRAASTLRRPLHEVLSGVAHPVRLDLTVSDRAGTRIDGAMLWTHFGISGPAALDMSRHWLRARLEGRAPVLTANLTAGRSFEAVDADWTERARAQPRSTLQSGLARDLPASVAAAVLERLALDARQMLATVSRADRRRLVHALLGWPLAVLESRGYSYAEVTAGGQVCREHRGAALESRAQPMP